jgi:5,10-methylene-tetrahydrofolate dehydrogenase/methenyl tetrahydrofolate cyclohydrolase
VGPLTNALLLTHLIRAAERQASATEPASAAQR